MNPNSTMFDPRPYPYMRCRLSLVSIQRRRVEEAAQGATRGSPNSLAYSGTFQKLLVLLR
ncbi:hypothetical protein F383_31050 [Gossypium arboreum]|uniref:Uncharacterized protein n=1 Tax=Gossypium arboreum TaxID=29729 RepID=A0A0B0PL75_GOSAR|nr:hypothetical protein F383_31050 [Gossypium arboreum]